MSDPRVGEPVPPVELIPVDDPVGVIRVKDREVLVSGSGDGLVDAAAAGLIDGTELIRYTGSLAPGDVADAVDAAVEVVITDANRQRAHHWRSSQDVVGFTEDGDPTTPDVLRARRRRPAPAGVRHRAARRTRRSPSRRVRSGPRRRRYGEPFAYRPEDRAVHAIDGDPTTAWVVGDRFDPIGERLLPRDRGAGRPADAAPAARRGGVRHIGVGRASRPTASRSAT